MLFGLCAGALAPWWMGALARVQIVVVLAGAALSGGEHTLFALSLGLVLYEGLRSGVLALVPGTVRAALLQVLPLVDLPLTLATAGATLQWAPSFVVSAYASLLSVCAPMLLAIEAIQLIALGLFASRRLAAVIPAHPLKAKTTIVVLALVCEVSSVAMIVRLFGREDLSAGMAALLGVVATLLVILLVLTMIVEDGVVTDHAFAALFIVFVVWATFNVRSAALAADEAIGDDDQMGGFGGAASKILSPLHALWGVAQSAGQRLVSLAHPTNPPQGAVFGSGMVSGLLSILLAPTIIIPAVVMLVSIVSLPFDIDHNIEEEVRAFDDSDTPSVLAGAMTPPLIRLVFVLAGTVYLATYAWSGTQEQGERRKCG